MEKLIRVVHVQYFIAKNGEGYQHTYNISLEFQNIVRQISQENLENYLVNVGK